jgi:hypothetical protein
MTKETERRRRKRRKRRKRRSNGKEVSSHLLHPLSSRFAPLSVPWAVSNSK